MNRSWPTRLDGLLKNKVQDYLVHTVTAGWLNDFEGVSVKQDYQAMAAQDLDDIVYIVGLKSFGFAEKERAGESDKDAESDGSAQGRCTDEEKVDNIYTVEAGERKTDEESTEAAAQQPHTERKADADKTGGQQTHADERSSDDIKATSDYQGRAAERHSKSDTESADAQFDANTGGRNADDDTVDIRHDYTDWSGTSPLIWEKDLETS